MVAEESAGLRSRFATPTRAASWPCSPDLLVLSTGIAPAADNPVLSGILRSALTADGFFLEAHPKLRPVDLANEGEFLCGLAHSPRFIDETIAQAQAVAGRAATILSKTHLEIAGQVAHVNPANCVACATCVKVCPYGAPDDQRLNKAEIQGAKCMGCGSCVAACPARAIALQHQEDQALVAMLDELLVEGVTYELLEHGSSPLIAPAPVAAQAWEPKIIAFCCNYCAYAAADLAGSKRMQYPHNVRIIPRAVHRQDRNGAHPGGL